MGEVVLITWLWYAANGNVCAASEFSEIPASVSVITKEEIHIAPHVSPVDRLRLRAEREIRLQLEHCPRPKDREA